MELAVLVSLQLCEMGHFILQRITEGITRMCRTCLIPSYNIYQALIAIDKCQKSILTQTQILF